MERSSSFSVAGFVEFLFFYGFLNWVLVSQNLYYLLLSFCQFQVECFVAESKIHERKRQSDATEETMMMTTTTGQCCCNEDGKDMKLRSRDVEMVMANMGMFCDTEGEKMKEWVDSDEVAVLFEEKEPSLEEVKEAFNVFDENRDGFIDANELQRVLCILGFREALDFDACQRMLRVFDANGDDRIDFNEFVKFMENSFC